MKPESFGESVSEVWFSGIQAGDTIIITTGKDKEETRFEFLVTGPSDSWPLGYLSKIKPDGSATLLFGFEIALASGQIISDYQTPPNFTGLSLEPNTNALTMSNRIVTKHPDSSHPHTIGGEISLLSIRLRDATE